MVREYLSIMKLVLSTFALTVVVTVTGMTMPVLPDEGLRVL